MSVFSLCRAALPTGLLAARGQEADSNGDRARKMQRELDATRRDAEGMLQVGVRPSPSTVYTAGLLFFCAVLFVSMLLVFLVAGAPEAVRKC